MLGSPSTAEFRHEWLLFSFGPPEDMLDGPLMRWGPAGGLPGGVLAPTIITVHDYSESPIDQWSIIKAYQLTFELFKHS